MLGIRITIDRSWYRAETFRRRVAPHAASMRFFPVNLYKLRKINIVAKRTGDTDQVSLVAVAGELDAVSEAGAQIGEKFPRRLPATVANVPGRDQLRVRVNCS